MTEAEAGAPGCVCRSAVLGVDPCNVGPGGRIFRARLLVPVLVAAGLELRVAGATEVDRVGAGAGGGRLTAAALAVESGPI